MDKIIDRVDRNLIVSELTHDKLLRHANKGVNEVYVVDAFNAPNTMREIGRLREIAFRDAAAEAQALPATSTSLTLWTPLPPARGPGSGRHGNRRWLQVYTWRRHPHSGWRAKYRHFPYVLILAEIHR